MYSTGARPGRLGSPCHRDIQKIQSLEKTIRADTGFEDEAAVDLRERLGKTWSAHGIGPDVDVTGKRGRLNILYVVTPDGELKYHVVEKNINS